MPAVEVRGVTIRAGGELVLGDIDLEVDDGERLVVLGASGSGKTLLLRVLAGLDRPEAGRVVIAGAAVDRPRRDVTMVFQGDATYQHLDVEGNLGFPLLVAPGTSGSVADVSRRFAIRRLLGRRPATLSDGQRRAVAAARALVRDDVRVVLMDEPLVGTDPARRAVVVESVLADDRVTVVVATNEPADALRWGDRVAVLAGRRVGQVGPPADVYRSPVSLAVAELTGELNRFPATLEQEEGWWAGVAGSRIRLATEFDRASDGRHVVVGIRPPQLQLAMPGTAFARTLQATVGRVEQLGARQRVLFGLGTTPGTGFVAEIAASTPVRKGDRVVLAVPESLLVFDPVSGVAIGKR